MNMRWIATMVLAAAALGGCVEREMKITSEPAGALVYVSDREVGRTPVALPFTWYADYDVLIRMVGYKTLRANADITPPWYEVPPLDLLSHMAPWTYRDQRFLHYKLEKQEQLTDEQLIKQAEEMKLRTGE